MNIIYTSHTHPPSLSPTTQQPTHHPTPTPGAQHPPDVGQVVGPHDLYGREGPHGRDRQGQDPAVRQMFTSYQSPPNPPNSPIHTHYKKQQQQHVRLRRLPPNSLRAPLCRLQRPLQLLLRRLLPNALARRAKLLGRDQVRLSMCVFICVCTTTPPDSETPVNTTDGCL